MHNRYIDLIEQTFEFPKEEFKVEHGTLQFNDIPLIDLIHQYQTPLRITYLPKITSQINKAKQVFEKAFTKHDYGGKYFYSYCTKASHFSFIMNEALKNDTHLETSSAFDIDLIERLMAKEKIDPKTYIICNGYKPRSYQEKIVNLINSQKAQCIPILDNMMEFDYYQENILVPTKLGIRLAADEQPNFEFYTSRLGIRAAAILDFYKEKIKDNPKFQLEMLHFFINTGIKDTTYYWSELNKAIKMYCKLKKLDPNLKYLNIGGGLPIKYSLGFDYDYQYMIDEIINQIKNSCREAGVQEPDIFTEFGNFTVGESGAIIFKVLDQKLQNDKEMWYMIDGSIMTTLPDIWGINQRFIMLPVNHWYEEYQKVNIGGASCDIHDYYNSEAHRNEVFLPKVNGGEPLYLGFFNVGAYQDELSGYGGIKHCMIPSPKHVLVSKNGTGKIETELFAPEQVASSMLNILGY